MKIAFLYLTNILHTPSTFYGPLGIAYIASYIEKYGNFNDFHIEIDVNKIIDLKPDIIGISSYTETYQLAKENALLIRKKLDVPIILGGPHITSLPYTLDKIFDIGIIGEAEITFLEILNLYSKTKTFNKKELKNIKGIVFFENDKLTITDPRENILNLDYLPDPKRKIMKYTSSEKTSKWVQHIHSSRGCPYECIFCAAKKLSGKVRYHSPERIVGQIEDIFKNFHQTEITFSDDLFTLSIPRLEKIVKLIKEEKLNKSCSFICCVRADNLKDDVYKLLKEMNVKTVCFGFESGDNKIIKYLKGKKITVQDNIKAIENSKKYNFNVVGNFILGSPLETKEQLANTYWFVNSNKNLIDGTYFCHATPFPLIEWWNEAIEKNLIDENSIDWKILNVGFDENKSIFLNENYSKDYFSKAYKKFKYLEKTILENMNLSEYNGLEYEQFYNFIDNTVNKILIISKKEREFYIKEIIKDLNNEIDLVFYNKDNFISSKKYDFIFLDHIFEFEREPLSLIKNLSNCINLKGKILILSLNPFHISNLISIINLDKKNFPKIINSMQNYIEILEKEFDLKLIKNSDYIFMSKQFSKNNITLISFLASLIKKYTSLSKSNVYSQYFLFQKV